MTRLYIVRHGEAEGNVYRRIHGQYDSGLTENGLRQVAALEERFRSIPLDAVYSSDLRRCRQTAKALYVPKGLPLHLDRALREMYFGQWEDKPWGLIGRTDPAGIDAFQHTSSAFRAPGGESYEELRQRAAGAWLRLAKAHEGQTIAIATHYIALRSALSLLHGYTVEEIATRIPKSDNTGVSCLDIENGRVKDFVFECDNSHLNSELTTLGKQKWAKGASVAAPERNLWYRPWNPDEERSLYWNAREEAWNLIHPGVPFDGDMFYAQAVAASREDPWAVVCAMQGDEPVGLLQMDQHRYAEERAGFIFFYYMSPKVRGQGLGIQLLGQAISYFRPKGRKTLRLRCSPDNGPGVRFYARNGFRNLGVLPGSAVKLELLEKRMD